MNTKTDIRIERMTEAHINGVAQIEALCFSAPWSAASLGLLVTDAAVGFVCVDGESGAVLAYGGMLYAPDEGQITNIATHPDARRRGYAQQIVEALSAHAREKGLAQISLEVRVSNEAAIALYRRQGFAVAGTRKHFYRNPTEDAYVMLQSIQRP